MYRVVEILHKLIYNDINQPVTIIYYLNFVYNSNLFTIPSQCSRFAFKIVKVGQARRTCICFFNERLTAV